jgi:ABC-type glycerol-3-phosphate transport system substrate-binding protein
VTRAFNDQSQAALTWKEAPDAALEQAQAAATRLLRSYQ